MEYWLMFFNKFNNLQSSTRNCKPIQDQLPRHGVDNELPAIREWRRVEFLSGWNWYSNSNNGRAFIFCLYILLFSTSAISIYISLECYVNFVSTFHPDFLPRMNWTMSPCTKLYEYFLSSSRDFIAILLSPGYCSMPKNNYWWKV